ncbi:IS3 family transposase [Delftia acidovorans]|uniref:IS3 family transposase n=1 Tax=Delftia acidovorans TaxID=80866 RepID=A0A7T2S9H4_DELAC|nr:IS3 family transposase [Delftia acidovorans]QPS11415.1 IS3 family transposase [Delftia acidovorans]
MSKVRPPYPAQFRQQMVELVRAGRTPAELSREFNVTAQSITNWVGQAAIDSGKPLPGKEGLTTVEREELARLRRQLRQVQQERDILAKANGLVCKSQRCNFDEVFGLVMANQADFPVRTMCRVLGISASGFYAWRERRPSQRSIANAVMTERIRQIHKDSYESYGMPRVRAELIEQGVSISRQRVARLMRVADIRGISRRRGFMVTTRRDKRDSPANDLVQRQFKASDPNQLWVADMTYVPTWTGFLYLAVVIDVWSRRVVGWSMGERMTTDLVLSALNMALTQRKPQDVIHHSDQGSQYTSLAFGERCRQMGVRPSTGTVGDAYDNAMAESFFASLEAELIERHSFESKAQARMAVFTWIEGWYNPRRRHSGLGYLSPLNFERSQQARFNACKHDPSYADKAPQMV